MGLAILENLPTAKERIAVLGVGLSANAVMVYAFDFLLYPFVIWKLGILKGGVVMMLLSFLYCYLTFLFYDWSKKDWLGIETVKGIKEYNGCSKIGRFASWILKKGNAAVMVFLSIKYDPFITTAYMRHGAHEYNGLNRRDWNIFLASTVIANVYWTIVAFAGVEAAGWVWKTLFPFAEN